MKHFKYGLILLLAWTTFTSCKAQSDLTNLQFLLGTWKIENKDTYESWDKINDNEYQGKSYKVNGDKDQISETLRIKILADKIIYEATVPNQNEGQTISFELNNSNKELISFENLDHDFPKKIQYKRIDNSKIEVNVLGEGDKGFSYYLFRQ